MANKLFLISATLAFFFLLTNASIYRTIVEFDEDEATNPGPFGPQKKCPKEFQQAHRLKACQRWMHKQAKQAGGGPDLDLEDDDDEDVLGRGPHERPPLLQECCSELHQEDPECVCKTLRRAAKAVRSQEGIQERSQVERVFQTARHLPNVCNFQKVGVCPFKAIPFFPPSY